jgi:hypothetical protein
MEIMISLVSFYLHLHYDNRATESYERPCVGLEEVSLTLRTEKLKSKMINN